MCSFIISSIQVDLLILTDEQGMLLYSVGSEIRKLDLRSGSDSSFLDINPKHRVVAVATCAEPGIIYWSNINVDEKTIMQSSLDPVDTNVIVDTGK